MNEAQKVSNKCFWWSLFLIFIFAAWLAVFMHWEVDTIKKDLLQYPESQIDKASLEIMNRTLRHLTVTYWKVAAASLAVVWILIWISFRLTLKRTLSEPIESPETGMPSKGKEITADKSRRRTLLLLSLLQREGRLVDFLEEDFQAYEDAQIGAAVRSIQETCKTSLNKYLDPKAVIDQVEGEEFMVPADFDPGAIKLTGNVTGRPPFKGILQHRGWKASRFDLPELSGTVNADIIYPAEVEIP